MVYVESIKSLHIGMSFGDTPLSQGTGFISKRQDRLFLVTNRHNFTGRHQDTQQPLAAHGGIPDTVHVWHRWRTNEDGWLNWKLVKYRILGDAGERLWHEHPTLGSGMDVVAFEIGVSDEIIVDEYPLSEPEQGFVFGPTDQVSVIGFPFGMSAAAKIAVWTTGTIATELVVDFDDKPVFLIDARTRQGQSGSPVIVFRAGGTFRAADGSYKIVTGFISIFMGIYSGRINTESDLGKVWKRAAIKELIDAIP